MPMRFAIISVTRASVPRSTLPHSRHLGQVIVGDPPLMTGLLAKSLRNQMQSVLRLMELAKNTTEESVSFLG
jgi:hypothetical protein